MDRGSTSKVGDNIPFPLDKLPEYNQLGPYVTPKPPVTCPYYCFVPKCKSSTKSTPEKMFIHVPFDKKRRKLWGSLACRDIDNISSKSTLTICEDHFDVQNDIENYLRLKLGFARTIKVKPGAFPQYFDCQGRSRRPKEPTGNSKAAIKQRQIIVLDAIRNRDEEIERERRKEEEIERRSKFLKVTSERLEEGKYIVMHRDLLDIRCNKSTQTDSPRMISRGHLTRPLTSNKYLNTFLVKTRAQASQTNTSTKRRKLSQIPDKLYYSDVYSSSSDENTSDGDDDRRDPLFIVEEKLNNNETRDSSTDSTISDNDEKL